MSLLEENQATDLEQMVGLTRRRFIGAGALCGAAMFLGGNLLSRSALAVDRHLVRMFDEAPTGLGAGRAGSLYKLARARYMTTPRLLISEQCKLLGISKSTYQNWLDALHDHLAERLSEDIFYCDTWNELNRLSGIKAAS